MRRPFALVALLLALTACRRAPTIVRVSDLPTTPAPSPTSPTPTPLRSGAPSATCVKGWTEPSGQDREHPLALLRRAQGLTGAFDVVDMRRFADGNGTIWWYAQVAYRPDRHMSLRLLATRERIVAVANYLTTGFRAPDWYGVPTTGDRTGYPYIPGTWPAKPTDFVTQGGLPSAVAGCLA